LRKTLVGSVYHSLFNIFSYNNFKQLTKTRLSISVVFSSLAGYFLAAPVSDFSIIIILYLFFGGYSLVSAANIFNQIIEKDLDKLMARTANRPIPTGRVSPKSAFVMAIIMSIIGILLLSLININTMFLGTFSVLIYTCLYTPLKIKTPLSVLVGAFPGAIPFILGWIAYSNSFGIEIIVLFLIQFFWQFPHFWSIGWISYDDYKKAGFKMLPFGKPNKSIAIQIIIYIFCMVCITLFPATGLTGELKLSITGAVIVFFLGIIIEYFAIKLLFKKTKKAAKNLLLVSIIYISLIQIVYVADKLLI